jgi:hypothetical protein
MRRRSDAKFGYPLASLAPGDCGVYLFGIFKSSGGRHDARRRSSEIAGGISTCDARVIRSVALLIQVIAAVPRQAPFSHFHVAAQP